MHYKKWIKSMSGEQERIKGEGKKDTHVIAAEKKL